MTYTELAIENKRLRKQVDNLTEELVETRDELDVMETQYFAQCKESALLAHKLDVVLGYDHRREDNEEKEV